MPELKERARLEKRVRVLEEVFTNVMHELKEECYECCDGEQDHETCWVEYCRIKRVLSMLDALDKEVKTNV